MSLFGSLFKGMTTGYGYSDLMGKMEDRQQSTSDMLGYGAGNTVRQDLTQYGQFKPWAVRGGKMGYFGQDAQGNSTYSVNQEQQAQADQMRQGAGKMFGQAQWRNPLLQQQAESYVGMGEQAAQNSMQNTAQREGDIYERIRAMQRPGEERQYSSMNANLFGGGRGGMTSGDFGGSPEQMAFGMAQAEARNSAGYQAMGQAQQEMMNQANMATQYGSLGQQALSTGGQLQNMQAGIGQQMFQNQYQPMQQLMQMAQQGQQGAQMYGQQQQGLAGMLAQLGIGQATTDVNWGNVQGDMSAGMFKALGEAAGGLGDLIPYGEKGE